MLDEKRYGFHAVLAVLEQSPDVVKSIWLQDGRDDRRIKQVTQLAKRHKIACSWQNRGAMDELTHDAVHQGVVAFCKAAITHTEDELLRWTDEATMPLVIVLDGVQDPRNLGACIRSADAAGALAVVAPKDNAAPYGEVARKVACGAQTPFVAVKNLARTLGELKERGLWLVGLDAEASMPVYQVDLTVPTVMILGAEGRGLRRLTAQHCDYLAHLPMAGTVGSLNVSVAAGVCLFEAVRQRAVGVA